jgi:hypothetical protein
MNKKLADKQLKVESILLADQVIEAKDNKKSLIGIFNQIFVENFPSVHPSMTLFVTLVGQGKLEREVKLQILSPSGEVKFNKDFKISMSDNGRSDLLMTFSSLPLEEPGEYDFVLMSEGKTIASYQLLVVMLRKSSDVVN